MPGDKELIQTAKSEIAAALGDAQFASALSRGAPAFLAGGQPVRIVWSNDAALALFASPDTQALARRCLLGEEPGARELERLSRRLEPGAPVRLQRMLFTVQGNPEMLTMMCIRFEGPNALFGAAALDVKPEWIAAPSRTEEPVLAIEPAVELESAPALSALPTQPVAPSGVEVAAMFTPAPSSSAAAALARDFAGLPIRKDRGGNIRFLWRTGRDGRLIDLTGALCETVGCDTAALIGEPFAGVIEKLGVDPTGALRAALARRETWSGVEVHWPVSGTQDQLPIVFGALPAFDKARNFDGFSGFGVIHLDRRASATRPASAAAPAALPPPSKFNDGGEADALDRPEESGEAPASAAPSVKAPDGASAAPPAPAKPVVGRNAPNVVALRRWQQKENAPANIATSTAPAAAPEAANDSASAAVQDSPTPSATSLAASPDNAATQSVSTVQEPSSEQEPAKDRVSSKDHAGARDQQETSSPAGGNADNGADNAAGFSARSVRFDGSVELSPSERNAFREIARALGARSPEADANTDAPARSAPSFVAQPQSRRASDDATARKAATQTPAAPEDQPAAENALPAVILDRVDAAILVTRGGVPAYANKTFLDTLGYATIDEFHDAGGVERMFKGRSPEALASDANGGAIPVIKRNGEIVALEGKLQTIDWAGEPATMMTLRNSHVQEMTARIHALELETRKREGEARELHAILDTATDGVAIIDGEGRILSLNKSGQALFGYEPNEIAGEKFTILLARESHSAAFDYLDGLRNNGVKSVLNDGREVTGAAQRGGAIPLFMTIGRIGPADSERFCAVLRDLTQWKKIERELGDARREAEHVSSLKSDFLAKISHEIRTPLNAIIGFAEVIIDERFGPVGNERYKDYLKDIHTSGNHVLSLVNDLLDLSKIEAGKLDLNFVAVDANKIVNECVSIMQAQAIRERVVLRLSLAPRLPNIVADERSLRQIVLNILSNAVKFNQTGGQVIVSTALTDAGHAVVRIRDTGIGMSEQEMETAIEPFRRVHTARPTTGTGLGLPLTKALTEANRAAFSIRSRKGEGTMVEIAFPPTRVLAE